MKKKKESRQQQLTRRSTSTAFVGRSHLQNAQQNGSGPANLETDAELHCTSQEIQQGCGNAGSHVDLHEEHHTGMLPESAGNSGVKTVWARVLEVEVPTVLCNSIVDDRRLCATGKEAPKQLQSDIQITRDFDGATRTRFNPLKSTCATPTKQVEKEVQQTSEQSGMKIVSFENQVGYPVTCNGNRDRTNQNKGTDEATRTVAGIARLSKGFGFEARARLIETNAIHRYQFAIECGIPNEQSHGALTSQIMRTLWPVGATMRSKETVLAVLVKGHRTDPVQVRVYQTLTTLKMMLKQRDMDPAVETGMGSHAEEKSQTMHRGIGGQRWQGPQEDRVFHGRTRS